jgi:hypothetical protein
MGAIRKDLDSSIDGVADSLRLYLPYAKANRWDPRTGVENEGLGHLLVRVSGKPERDRRGKQREATKEAELHWG